MPGVIRREKRRHSRSNFIFIAFNNFNNCVRTVSLISVMILGKQVLFSSCKKKIGEKSYGTVKGFIVCLFVYPYTNI